MSRIAIVINTCIILVWPCFAAAQGNARCEKNETQIGVNFNAYFRTHDQALARLRQVLLAQARNACAAAGAQRRARIVESSHTIQPGLTVCPLELCAPNGGTCPPCGPVQYILSADALVCCRPGGARN
jgi:hypothetical protein